MSSFERRQRESVWSGTLAKACNPPLMNIIWSCLGLSHYLYDLHLTLYGPKFIHSNSVLN